MNEQELCKKRLIDLSNQADRKGIVTFSGFLNLFEQNIYHSSVGLYAVKTQVFGGYDGSERQMVAFIPDALYYEWEYPICCIRITPQHPKYAEKLTHRDVLGAVMHLGIERGKCGDIVLQENAYFLFCEESIAPFLIENLTKIRHTLVTSEHIDEKLQITVTPRYEERYETAASGRIDCIIAKAYRLSRSEASAYLAGEKVFLDGRMITNGGQICRSGAIISVRGKGRFVFETDYSLSKKGKLRIRLLLYQ